MTSIRAQDGGVMVMFVMSVTLLLLATSFAIDASNFFRHKRQLQTQADAAALAGGGMLSAGCTSNEPIYDEADRYVGSSPGTFNHPAGADTGDVSHSYDATPDPCAEKAFEVEVTESSIDWFFPITKVADVLRGDETISATARVELARISSQSGSLPIALEEEVNVRGAWAWLVDERATADKVIPGTVRILQKGAGDAVTNVWSTAQNVALSTVTQPDIGVRVALDYAKSPSACATTATDACAENPCGGTVRCFDAGSSDGIVRLQAFAAAPTLPAKSPPALNHVTVAPSGTTCVGSGTFVSGTCSFTVDATVDWVDQVDAAPTTRASVTARIGSGATFPLTYTAGVWTGTSPAVSAAGPHPVVLAWEQKHGSLSTSRDCGTRTNNNAPLTGTPGSNQVKVCSGVWQAGGGIGAETPAAAVPVHRVFVAGDSRSGDIAAARAVRDGTTLTTLSRCAAVGPACPTEFGLELRLPSDLQLGSRRVLTAKAPGSNDGHLDCDPLDRALERDPSAPTGGKPKLIYQIAHGCHQPYAINDSDACPDRSEYGDEEPWLCVPPSTGDKTQALEQGLHERIYGVTGNQKPSAAVCQANANRYPNFEADDKRIVSVMVVSPGSLNSSGSSTDFPVRTFAYFYITGWGAKKAACDVVDSHNEPAEEETLVGHFIKYTHPQDGDAYGTDPCIDNTLDGCVPVMTE